MRANINAFLAFSLYLLCNNSVADTCHSNDKPSSDSTCQLGIDELHPTQFSVGSIAVDCKVLDIKSKVQKSSGKKTRKAMDDYLSQSKHWIPTVIGPDGIFYIIDHHHLLTALWRSNLKGIHPDDIQVNVLITASYKDETSSIAEFWSKLLSSDDVYNIDNKGLAHMNFSLLPNHVDKLLNDPFRTLSRWVRESCGYVKQGVSQCNSIRPDPPHYAPHFMEFYWGNFFRQQLTLVVKPLPVCKAIPYDPLCLVGEASLLKNLYPSAMALARSEKAREYFDTLGLNPEEYGFNPSGGTLKLHWEGDCEVVSEHDSRASYLRQL